MTVGQAVVFCADKADIQRLSEHFVAYMQPADFYDWCFYYGAVLLHIENG